MWSAKTLYVRFECRYRELFLFDDAEEGSRRDRLWERDVAEVFLQPDPKQPQFYKEFEISPNGLWIDLDILPDGQIDLRSGMQVFGFAGPSAAHLVRRTGNPYFGL